MTTIISVAQQRKPVERQLKAVVLLAVQQMETRMVATEVEMAVEMAVEMVVEVEVEVEVVREVKTSEWIDFLF